MIAVITFYIVVFCAESSIGLLVYKNDCGTLTVSEPAIDSKRVLLTFIPHGTVNQETEVEWKVHKTDTTWTINNSSKYILSSQQYIYTMHLYYKKSDKGQYSAEFITPAEECSSGWVSLDIRNGVFNITAKDTALQAPTGCGILYKGPKRIKPGDEVVLKYHQTKRDEYIRQLRVKTDDCAGQFGCPVNEAWYEEESAEYNSMYLYKFRNFSSEMEGNYLIQCTNRSSHNNATNDVKLIIPVPPSSPTFLNTVDIENCTSCLLVRSGKTAIQCQVIGGTPPVTVKIVIDGKDEVLCDFGQPFNKTCNATIYVHSGLHLMDIRCEAENEALDQPLTTSTKLYVVQNPVGPVLYSSQQTEGKVNISCKSWFGRPAPNLSLLIDGNIINTILVPTKDPDKHIKLTYLKKDWNGAIIKCCMTHLCYEKPKCSAENVYYLSEDRQISEGREKTLPWKYIGVGAAAGVVVHVIVTLLVIKRRKNTDRVKTGHEDIPLNASNGNAIVNEPKDEKNRSDVSEAIIDYENVPKIASRGQAIVNEPRDEQNGTDAYEAIIDHENVPRNASSGQAMVNEPRDEQIGSNAYEAIIEPSPSDRVYTDLVLPTEGATSGDPRRAFAEPQTEYLSKEFNKVGEQLPKSSDIELENMYVNQ